jgi:hypothetical protein
MFTHLSGLAASLRYSEIGLIGEGLLETRKHPGISCVVLQFEVVLQRIFGCCVFGRNDGAVRAILGVRIDASPAFCLVHVAVEQSHSAQGLSTLVGDGERECEVLTRPENAGRGMRAFESSFVQ